MTQKNNSFFTQCDFVQGTRQTSGWIPSWAAKKGNEVQLLDIDAGFWTVVATYITRPQDEVLERERDYKERQGSLRGGGIDERMMT